MDEYDFDKAPTEPVIPWRLVQLTRESIALANVENLARYRELVSRPSSSSTLSKKTINGPAAQGTEGGEGKETESFKPFTLITTSALSPDEYLKELLDRALEKYEFDTEL